MFWSKKDSSKVKNTLLQWSLKNIFIMMDSYKMDFMEGNVIIVKVGEMYNILKSARHSLFVER